jgi:ABC-type transport system substrate-binding protein
MRFWGKLLLLLSVLVISMIGGCKKVNNNSEIKMAITNRWGALTPAKQSTYAASVVLANVFESLVQFDAEGNIQSALATSWEVKPDFRELTFKIDTKRKFSNGTNVTAQLIKKSFEESLRVNPVSSNKSAEDFLYQVEGYEDFTKVDSLSGISVLSDDRLQFKFKKPFRQALTFLTGVRYAPYVIDVTGKPFGAGPYVIISESVEEVLLQANPYWNGNQSFEKIRIKYVSLGELENAVCEEKHDLFWLVSPAKLLKCGTKAGLKTGGQVSHLTVNVNGMKGRLFSDHKMRSAIQYLILRKAAPQIMSALDESRSTLDYQFFLPLQQGRLSDNEFNEIVDEGEKWVPELISRSKLRPIHIAYSNMPIQSLIAELRILGLSIREDDLRQRGVSLFDIYYKSFDYDLCPWGVTMDGLDPDSLYHYLGQYGAVSSPTIGRPLVWKLFEEGRSEVNNDKLHERYQNLSRAILQEVPAIHLAFYRMGYLYGPNVKPNHESINSYKINMNDFSSIK